MSLSACRQVIDTLNDALAKGVSWFTLLMAILMLAIVLLRYGFNLGWVAMQESVMYLHVMVFMLGAAHTLKVDEHVRVDIFFRRLGDKGRAWVDLLGTLLLLMPMCLFVLFASWDYVTSSWRLLEGSPQAGGLPMVFLLKSLLPLFAITLLLQGLAQVMKCVLVLLAKEAA